MTCLLFKQRKMRGGLPPPHRDFLGGGGVPGAMRIGAFWAIPDDAAKPTDARIKNGKYIKKPVKNEK